MLTLPIKTLCLCVCLVEAAWLLLAQALGSLLLLIPCLVCFLVIMVWAAVQNMAIPVFLFFLPFSPLLKMAPNTISFYTMALLAVYAIYAVKGHRNVRIVHIVPALALIILTLTVKLLSGFSVSNVYILFSVSLLLVPFLTTEMDGRYDFYWATVFFVLGIVTAALTSQLLADSSSIARYINVINELGIDRRTGYFNDPNFYSAHVAAALGGVLVLLLNQVDKVKRWVLICMAVLLLYCGLLSISKSFLLISVCLLLCWFLAFMFQKGRISSKILMIITLCIVAIFILSSTVFMNLLELMLSRLSNSSNLSDFTTRRVELWAVYFRAFREEPLLLLFGKGYSDVLVEGRAAHNTIIQAIYQFGLLGCGFLVAWFVCFIRTMIGNNARRLDWAQMALLIIGAFGPWIGLDYLFFDELFLLPVYVCTAVRFLHRSSTPERSLMEGKCGIADEGL